MAIDRDNPIATPPLTSSPQLSPSHHNHHHRHHSGSPDPWCQATPLANSLSDPTGVHTPVHPDHGRYSDHDHSPDHDYSENEARRNSYTYTTHPFYDKAPEGEAQKIPLSMRFMHKPSRSGEFFKQANDPTRRNSLINSQTGQEKARLPSAITTSNIDDMMEDDHTSDAPSSPSPSSPHEHYKLVRKKSGEILKPSLKDSSYFDKKRSKSLPSTPTYKQVHFGGDNVVKYFKKKDRPTAISASNSPTLDGTDSLDLNKMALDSDDSEDNGSAMFDSDDDDWARSRGAGVTNYPHPHHGRLINWALELPNFREISYHDKINLRHQPVFLERIFLTVDKKYLLGHVAVKNLSYEKAITVRYTLDDWCTIIEIPTIYVPDVPSVLKINNYDRFIFKIPLDSLFNSFRSHQRFNSNDRRQDNVYNLCIRYNVPGNEFWDNNDGANYLIKLTKTVSSHVNDNDTSKVHHLAATSLARPTNPATKIQDHSQKPKYSSAFLKRRVSDSDIKNKHDDDSGSFNTNKIYGHDNGSSDFNDFIKNNYYLSSPLLSSYNDRDDDVSTSITPKAHEVLSEPVAQPEPKPEPFKINFSIGAPEDDVPETKRNFSSSISHNSFNKNYLDSKSYKELLDSYCFFTTPKHKGSSDFNMSYSPDDNSRHAYFDYNNSSSYSKNYGARNNSKDGSRGTGLSTHTVSSFLGN